jgi:hypothetical protein
MAKEQRRAPLVHLGCACISQRRVRRKNGHAEAVCGLRVPGKQPRKVSPRPCGRARRINKRVLPNHCPALQFSGDQDFSNFWSCMHVFYFLQQNWLRACSCDDLTSAWLASGLIFSAAIAISFVRQIDRPSGIATTLFYEKDLEVRELALSGAAKRPQRMRKGVDRRLSGRPQFYLGSVGTPEKKNREFLSPVSTRFFKQEVVKTAKPSGYPK